METHIDSLEVKLIEIFSPPLSFPLDQIIHL